MILHKSGRSFKLALTLAGALTCVSPAAIGAAAFEYWLPVAVSTPGLRETLWRTEMALLNLSCSQLAAVQMFLYTGGAVHARELTVPPSRQLVMSDVIGETFGLARTSGALRILSSAPLVVAGRVYNQTAAGTLGQTMRGVDLASGFSAGDTVLLPALRETSEARSNIQILNMGGDAASVRVRLVVAGGQEQTKVIVVPPRSLRHLQQPLLELAPTTAGAWAEVTIDEGTAVWPFASVVDNRSGDATTITPLSRPALPVHAYFGAVARVPGLAGTAWRTSLSVLNPGASDLTARLRFSADSGAQQQHEVVLAGGEQRIWDDAIKDLFGLTQASGSLVVDSDAPIATAVRVFNQTPTGSFGQSVAAIAPAATLGTGASAVLPFLRQSVDFRSNVDLINSGATTASVRLVLFVDGRAATVKQKSVQATARLRIDQVFLNEAGLNDVRNGFAVLTVVAGEGLWFSGSVVDQTTGDPTTLTAAATEISSPPTAAFDWAPSPFAAGVPVTFYDRSTCFPHDWRWEFESLPSVSGQARVERVFPSAGTYSVRLTAINAAGASPAQTRAVRVEEPVVARFVASPSPTAVGLAVTFEDRSTGPVDTWLWDFGDGTTATQASPTHTFTAPGEYVVKLTVQGAGSEDSHEERLQVKVLVANFDYQPWPPKVGEEVRFFDRSLGQPRRWIWGFGDGQQATEQHPRHTFLGGGPYQVSLTVSNDVGGDTASRTVTFLPELSIQWLPSTPETGSAVSFSGESTAPVNWWGWNPGDGHALRWGQNIEHRFASEGLYSVSLTAGNQAGTGWRAASVSVRGPCTVPSPPEIMSLDGAASSCPYYVRWSPTSPQQSYELQASTDPTFVAASRSFSVEGVNESPRFGPDPGSSERVLYYRVRARAGDYCDQQWSPWSNVIAVTVGPSQPCQVKVLSLPSGREIELVRVPAGSFVMGSSTAEPWRFEDETPHQVTISTDFYVGRHEVTQGLWREVMGSNPTRFAECGDDCPQDSVSWFAACGQQSRICGESDGFIQRLNDLVAGQLQSETLQFRLPTEAEWEYAARAGGSGPYVYPVVATPTTTLPLLCDGACGGCPELDRQAWWCANALDGVRVVGRKSVNPWGLYDVIGNLAEWVEDWYDAYPVGPAVDPHGPARGSYRVLRGGAWYYYARFARLAQRLGDQPGYGDFAFGIRVVLAPPLLAPSGASAAGGSAEAVEPPSRSVRKGPRLTSETIRRRAEFAIHPEP